FDVEGAAFTGLTFQPDPAVVTLHYVLHIAQAKAESFGVVDISGSYAVQTVEDLAVLGARDPDAIVGNAQGNALIVTAGADTDLGFLLGVFDRVIDQVVEQVGKVDAVAADVVQLGVQLHFHVPVAARYLHAAA